ncbi:PhoH family protein [Ammoniphilus sp. 3BR4]|uniref:PhoH family protein n=1 Tax=Ammoniphilus sp. 3BR4 TaxID=3158265 RepID=UPI003465AD97
MIKTFILDTSAIIEDPKFILSLQDNIVIIPEVVLEELDHLKENKGYKGHSAREALRTLDDLANHGKTKEVKESLAEGIHLPGGGVIKVELNHIKEKMPHSWIADKSDNRILQVCIGYIEEHRRKANPGPVLLVTEDAGLRVKADTLQIPCESIRQNRAPKLTDQYTGRTDCLVDPKWINTLQQEEWLDPQWIGLNSQDLVANQFIILQNIFQEKHTYVGMWTGEGIIPIKHLGSHYPAGIKPRNLFQQLMIHMCLLPAKQAPCVIIKGPAGTAKTLIGVACGYHQVRHFGGYKRDEVGYRKLLVCRPAVSDEDLGYLPGTEQEKLAPYMRPIRDNLETILRASSKNRESEELQKELVLQSEINKLFESGIIDCQAVGFLRGRSIPDQYIIVDEAQNLTGSQVEMILTRIGEGSKLVLLGDPKQIDHPYLDERSNGLSVASEIMKGDPLCIQLTLSESESVRSPLAKSAAERFNRRKQETKKWDM